MAFSIIVVLALGIIMSVCLINRDQKKRPNFTEPILVPLLRP